MFEKYKIKSIRDCIYILEDFKGKEIEKAIIFYDIEPKVGDVLFIPQSVIKEQTIFNYGPIGSEYAKEDVNEEELIKLESNGVGTYLQRYYG